MTGPDDIPINPISRRIPALRVSLLGLLALTLFLPGCGSCRRGPKTATERAKLEAEQKKNEEERKKKEEEQKKPDFVFRQLDTYPSGLERLERTVKPGHWISGELQATANHLDFNGQLALVPLDLDEMPFRLGGRRPAILPKTQLRAFELQFFIPPGLNPKAVSIGLDTAQSREVYRETFPIARMPAHQFYLLVLARAPDQYGFIRELDTVKAPGGNFSLPGSDNHYRVLTPLIKKKVPVSDNSLTWTNVACVVWDELQAEQLSPTQQTALVDWLHWGGQLLISGPGSLPQLRGTFLEPYLPADGSDTQELASAQLADAIGAPWSFAPEPLGFEKPLSGVAIKPRPDATVTITAGDVPLVVDRRVGRGRIVVTAFPLASRALVNWSGFDNFFNGCLLRRPARRFLDVEGSGTIAVAWADAVSLRDPRRVSDVRYFTRDAGAPRAWHASGLPYDPQTTPSMPSGDEDPLGEDQRAGPGVAGWDDFNAVGDAAREALREAAGITIPDASFVVTALAAYLIVLVPVNWTFFRLLGRVELAWVAAPIISIAGALMVVRAAQLDIGFVRAANELNVIEVQADYPRAHVTRYAALYTSLSTGYEVHLDDPGALVQPFPDATGLLRGQSRTTVTLVRNEKAKLENFRVASNSIGMLHAEHPLVLDGPITIEHGDGWQLKNGSQLNLEDIQIVYRGRVTKLDALKSGESKFLLLDGREPADPTAAENETSPPPSQSKASAAAPSVKGEVNVAPIAQIAKQGVPAGEIRLVATTRDKLPGMSVSPVAAQQRSVSVVVAHLKYGPPPAPAIDVVGRPAVEAEIAKAVRREVADLDSQPGANR